MANFDAIAHHLFQNGGFAWSSFWQTYNPPTLVALRAIQIVLLGDTLTAWRIFQLTVTLTGLLWLSYELWQQTNRRFYSVALIWIVTLSQSSIFWSLKLAREGLAEGLSYITIAITLLTFRRPTIYNFFIAGILYMIASFNRVNFLVMIPFFIILFFWIKKTSIKKEFKRYLLLIACFLLGIGLIWAPWIIRNYQLYHHFFPLATQGGNTFLWELGDVEMTDVNGQIEMMDIKTLQSEAEERFSDDYEYYVYTQQVVARWISQHWREYPLLIAQRIYHSAVDTKISLTKVSRQDIFPGSWDIILFDRQIILILIGFLGLILFSWKYPSVTIIFMTALFPWLATTIFIGYPRMLEPAIPLILFGAFYLIYQFTGRLIVWLKRYSIARPAKT